MDAKQLRLFPAPKPLIERFGKGFFKRIPSQPGVYLMGGEGDGLLYVGKAQNLRQRLNSYKNAQPGRVSRKIIRLVHQVRSITWEVCASPTSALLRENELLRLHKPKFNVLNARPEHYLFLGLSMDHTAVHLRLTKANAAGPAEQLFGAFKNLGRVRASYLALLRLLWSAEHQAVSPYDLPASLFKERPPENLALSLNHLDRSKVGDHLRDFLSGKNEHLLPLIEEHLPAGDAALPCLRRINEHDLECLRDFFTHGPARNRKLRERCDLDSEIIEKSELDDLLVLAAD